MSELKPCQCDLNLLNDRILNLGAGLATMPENGTMQVNKAFLTAIMGYMEELLCMRRAQPTNEPLNLKQMQELLERLEAECREAGDGHEDYTNGYRWGHRNGQIELLRRILNVREGACESDLRRKPEGGTT